MAWNASAAATSSVHSRQRAKLIVTVTPDLSVQACKNASLGLANVAWYVLHAVQTAESRLSALRSCPALSSLYTLY